MSQPRFDWRSPRTQGVLAALLSAVVLGLSPIFAKQAYAEGVTFLPLIMLRTVLAASVLWGVYLIFMRRYIYIYPVGLAECLLAGVVNGLGSVLYYSALMHLNASLAQLLYTLYLIFLTLFSWVDGYRFSRLTILRVGLAALSVILLKWVDTGHTDWGAALLMIGSGMLYALHLSITQRTLYDVPAPTVTLYSLTGMAATVCVAYLAGGAPPLPATPAAWQPILLLMLATLLSRLLLFVGVRNLGGVQAVLISLSEALVTVLAAIMLLGEMLTPVQWVGAGLLIFSVMLVTREQALGALPPPTPWMQLFARFMPAPKNPYDKFK